MNLKVQDKSWKRTRLNLKKKNYGLFIDAINNWFTYQKDFAIQTSKYKLKYKSS